MQQGLPQDLAGMNPRAIDGTAEELLEGDEPMAAIEVQAAYLNTGDRPRQPQTSKPTNSAEIACF
jgi:hypothetical protein